MGFTFSYEGDGGIDVLEAALKRLIRPEDTIRPWVADVTYFGPDDEEIVETVGLVDVLDGDDVNPTWLLTRAYDVENDTFAPAYREKRIALVTVSNVKVV